MMNHFLKCNIRHFSILAFFMLFILGVRVEASMYPIHDWGENDRKGTVGTVFRNATNQNHEIGYFRLIGLGGDGRYWYYPSKGQKTNTWWEFLGNTPEEAEQQYKRYRFWGEQDRLGKIGDIYINKNNPNHDDGYFLLTSLGSDDRYWYFPEKGSRANQHWFFLGYDLQIAEKIREFIHVKKEPGYNPKVGDLFLNTDTENPGVFELQSLMPDGSYADFPAKEATPNSYDAFSVNGIIPNIYWLYYSLLPTPPFKPIPLPEQHFGGCTGGLTQEECLAIQTYIESIWGNAAVFITDININPEVAEIIWKGIYSIRDCSAGINIVNDLFIKKIIPDPTDPKDPKDPIDLIELAFPKIPPVLFMLFKYGYNILEYKNGTYRGPTYRTCVLQFAQNWKSALLIAGYEL